MLRALLYLQAQSFKNKTWARVRRLRRPKYLFGALFGAAYFALILLRPLFLAGRGYASPSPEVNVVWEFIAAAVLLFLAALVWLLPNDRAGLVFTEAEIAFLFPAPVRRTTLVHFKLLKTQLGILLTVTFFGLLSLRFGGLATAGMRAAGLWLLFSLINLHALGVSFTRTLLFGRGVSTWAWRGAVLGAGAAAVAGIAFWVSRHVPAAVAADLQNGETLLRYVRAVADAPPVVLLLAPFRAAVRPALSTDGATFWRAFVPALALLAAHYVWVLKMDVAFEEASLETSRKHAVRVAAMRTGHRWGGGGRPRRKARAPFQLSPTGTPAVALLWKNLISAGQLFSLRVAAPIAFWGLVMGYSFNGASRTSPWPQVVATAAVVLAAFSVLVGPQIVRQDFRGDMAAIDLLKTYPLTGRQLAFGQLLSPLVILTGFQWLLLAVAALLFDGARLGATPSAPVALAACLALVGPPMNLIILLLPNGAALLFPGWFQPGAATGRGLDVMGQRLILMVALLAVFALTVAPAAVIFALVYLVAAPLLLPAALALPAAALAASITLAVEGMAGIAGLGYLFERFDPSAEIASSP